ncbi:MAG: hypothetical protein HDR72_05145 [Ruminococcaceae bacterium]|nr:hypothetical protein [Oscillospiraceae bacterium]
MNSVRSVFSVCAQNFRKWDTDYRMWTIAALLVVMTFAFADDMRKNAAVLGSDVSIWIFPFLYLRRYMKLVFTLPVILVSFNAPFIDKNQTFVIFPHCVCVLAGAILLLIIGSFVFGRKKCLDFEE